MSDDERRKLVSTEQSLGMAAEPRMPAGMAALEGFSLGGSEETLPSAADYSDADSFFNLPDAGEDEDEDEDDEVDPRR